MDPRFQIVQHLYGTSDERAPLPAALAEDAALRAEHRAMSEVKFSLDHRPRARPDAAVLDRVVARAAVPAASPPGAARPDRPPRAHARYRRALVGLVVTGIAVAAVGIGLWLPARGAAEPEAAAAAPPPSLALPLPAAPDGATTLEAYARDRSADLLEWDEGDDVRTLQRRIDVLEARSAVPVGSGRSAGAGR